MKKLKLFLSICAICLSISVFCLGVYAAQTVTYTIGGTVSYTVKDAFVKINTKVYKVSGKQTTDTMQTNIDTLVSTAFSSIDTTTYILDNSNTIAEYDTTSGDTASREVNITIDNTYMTYYIVINIENLSSRNVCAKLTDGTTYTNLNTAGKYIQNDIAKDTTRNLVVAFSLNDNKTSTTVTINYSVEVGYNEYIIMAFGNVALKNDKTNKYYYVELGQVSSSDTTKLKWRLVSLKGTSVYTYSTETPTVGSGSVFVQETALTNNSVAWGSSSSNTNYFTESTLRTSIKGGSLFNLTEDEQKYLGKYIKARTLDNISWSCYNYSSSALNSGNTNGYTEVSSKTFAYPYKDSSHSALTSTSKGTDYFWLMSVDEMYTYFKSSVSSVSETTDTSHSEFVWKPSGSGVSFWLRSPCYRVHGYYNDFVTCIYSDGSFYVDIANLTRGVRAAFQLA